MVDDEFIKSIQSKKDAASKRKSKKEDLGKQLDSTDAIQQTIVHVAREVVKYIEQKHTTVEVENPVTTVNTPDFKHVTKAVARLERVVDGKKVDLSALGEVSAQLKEIHSVLGKLPTSYPDMPKSLKVDGIEDMRQDLKEAIALIDKKTYELNPEIKVPKPHVEVTTDLAPVAKAVEKLEEAINAIVIPEPSEVDLSGLERSSKKANEQLDKLIGKPFPVPEFPTTMNVRMYGYYPATDSWLPVLVDSTGKLEGVGGGGGTSSVYDSGVYGTATYA